MAQTVSQFLTDVRLQAALESVDPDWPDATLLGMAYSALKTSLVPRVSKLRQGHYTTHQTYVPVGGSNPFDHLYRLPERVYGRIGTVSWLNASGIEQPLEETTRAKLLRSGTDVRRQGNPSYFWLENGRFGVYPRPTTGYLRVRYTALPLPMDSAASYATITSIDVTGPDTVTLTLDASPGWSASQAGVFALSAAEPHAQLDSLGTVSVSTNVVTLTRSAVWPWSDSSTYPGLALVGDVLVRATLSPLVQVPVELYQALVFRTTILGALSDQEYDAARILKEQYVEAMADGIVALGDRTENSSALYSNDNGPPGLTGPVWSFDP